MLKLAVALMMLSISMTAKADEVGAVGNALGRVLLGSQFTDNTGGEWTMSGDGCSVELNLQSGQIDGQKQIFNFHIIGRKGSNVVIMNAFRPTTGTLRVEKKYLSANQTAVHKLSFESVGPCLGGIFPGSASCDVNKDSVIVKTDPNGKTTRVELRHKYDKFFVRDENFSCSF